MYFEEPSPALDPMRMELRVVSAAAGSFNIFFAVSPGPSVSWTPVFGADYAPKSEMTFALGPRATSAGYRLFAFDKAGSTNAEAMSRARDGERGPAWFVTSEQTAGRGRRQRAWIAPRGNLASSVLEVM
ncbi:hypothetical protein OY671_011881, partial [Metschnikowia pulcherrima]